MNIVENIASIDRKFAWSFLGFLLAVFFGGLTIYNEFIKIRDPKVVVEVLSNASVLDLRENLPGLKIIYGDVDIKSVGKDLSILIFRVKNIGGASVLGSFYDINSPFSVNLSNGEFLKVENLDASNKYLAVSANAEIVNVSKIRMPAVIMEPDESYVVKALVIHGAGAKISVVPSGKIAGMRDISVVEIESDRSSESFWSKVASGSIGVQFVRMPFYFFALFFFVFAAFVPPAMLANYFSARRRSRVVAQFLKRKSEEIPDDCDAIFHLYKEDGLLELTRLRDFLADPKLLEEAVRIWRIQTEAGRRGQPIVYELGNGIAREYRRLDQDLRFIQNSGIMKIEEDGRYEIDDAKRALLGRFVEYVNIKEG